MRIKREVEARTRRLTHASDDYEFHYETDAARHSKIALRRVASTLADEHWTIEKIALQPPRVTFRRESEALELVLLPLRDRAFMRTSHFGVAYRCQGTLSEPMAELTERFVKAVAEAEQDSDWRAKLTRIQVTDVAYYPREQRIEFRPTLACNHHCEFCNSVERNATDSVGGIQEFLDQIDAWRSLPVVSAVISGGEPTLLKRLPDLVAALADQGFDVEVQTNGMSLADRSYVDRLEDAGVRTLLVSLHSAKAAHSNRSITKFDGAWERTVMGIDNAIAAGINVHLSHVVHRDNFTETADFMRMVRARWGRRVLVRLAYVAPTGAARAGNIVPHLSEAAPYLRHGLAVAQELGVRVLLVSYCGVPPCLIAPHHRFSEVVRGGRPLKFNEDHLHLPACAGCRYEDRCPGLWRRYYERHGDPGLRAM